MKKYNEFKNSINEASSDKYDPYLDRKYLIDLLIKKGEFSKSEALSVSQYMMTAYNTWMKHREDQLKK